MMFSMKINQLNSFIEYALGIINVKPVEWSKVCM